MTGKSSDGFLDSKTDADVINRGLDILAKPFRWAYQNDRRYFGIGYKRLSFGIGIFLFFIISMVYGIILSPFVFLIESVGDGEDVAAGVFMVPAGLTVVYAFWRARQRRQAQSEALELQEQASPDAAAQAFAHLDAPDDETRAAASYTITTAAESGPGKVVKASGRDPDEIVARLVERFDDVESKVQSNVTTAVRWFSEDYPEAVAPHDEAVLSKLDSDSSGLQVQAAVVLGNLGRYEPGRADEYADRLGKIVNDPDHEVRKAVAIGAGQLSSQRATDILEQLVDDRNDDVSQTAEKLLERRREPETTTEPDDEFTGENPYGDARSSPTKGNPYADADNG